MPFKEIADLSADVTISLGGTNRKTGKKNPTRVEGYYLGLREVADNKKKSGKSYIYFLQTPKGNVGVWGKTDMDRKMGSVPVGSMIFIEFDRMVPTPNGDMYKYKVGVDNDNTIEVDSLPVGQENTDLGANDYVQEETEEETFTPPVAARGGGLSKVQELLNRSKKN